MIKEEYRKSKEYTGCNEIKKVKIGVPYMAILSDILNTVKEDDCKFLYENGFESEYEDGFLQQWIDDILEDICKPILEYDRDVEIILK